MLHEIYVVLCQKGQGCQWYKFGVSKLNVGDTERASKRSRHVRLVSSVWSSKSYYVGWKKVELVIGNFEDDQGFIIFYGWFRLICLVCLGNLLRYFLLILAGVLMSINFVMYRLIGVYFCLLLQRMTAILMLWLGCVGSLVVGSLGAFFVSRFMSRVSRTTMFSI